VCGIIVSTVVLITTAGRHAWAQPSSQQIAVAEALVEQGNALMERGLLDEACQKFEAADRAAESWAVGALGRLAECHEKAGRLASAWATWIKAELAATRAAQKDRADYARTRAAELDGRVPRLTLIVPDGLRAQAEAEVRRDGALLPREEWGLAIRVDPGRHTIRVAAPLRLPWEASLELQVGEVRVVAPARLEDAPAPAPAGVAKTDDGAAGKVQRRVGLVVGAVGVAGIALWGALGAATLAKSADARSVCGPQLCATATAPGAVLAQQARMLQTGAIVASIFGSAVLVSGVAIYVTAPRPRPPAGGSVTAFLELDAARPAARVRVAW
jgi:tetratricopeptide (TPR) repeat protein